MQSAGSLQSPRAPRLGVLSVHYRLLQFLVDQHRRLGACAKATAAGGWEPWYFPVVHGETAPEIATAAGALSGTESGLRVSRVDLRQRDLGRLRHKDSLLAAYRELRESGRLRPGDLVAVMDHDAHPLRPEAFAATAARLATTGAAGVGHPQWHHGHCYLHPSFLLTRVETIDEIGPELALASCRDGSDVGDTAEGFTYWCEENGRPTYPLRVVSTGFPWDFWKSQNVEGESPRLRGTHGEAVHVGHLMRYGLPEGPPLFSHVCSVTLGGLHFSRHTEAEVLAAYFAEPDP